MQAFGIQHLVMLFYTEIELHVMLCTIIFNMLDGIT